MRFAHVLAVAALCFASVAAAADLAVLPVGVRFDAGHDRAAITVTNQGNETVVMQVETVDWTQEHGQDRYTPTHDLLVNPPLFRLAPGASQILRVGLRRPPSGEREQAYRLFLREVPPPPPPGAAMPNRGGRIRVLLELRLPVYVEPVHIIQRLDWQARRTAGGGIAVTATNTGTVHAVVSELSLSRRDSSPLAKLKDNAAIFPGQSHTWTLHPKPAAPGQRFTLKAMTDRGPQDVALDLGQR